MNDSEVIEDWLTQVFAHVDAPPAVEAWRDPASRRTPIRNSSRKLRAIGLTAGIAVLLFIASVAGTLALTHSHPSSQATTHPNSAPAATNVASPPAQSAASCSRPLAPVSPYAEAFPFYSAGAAQPAIACQQAIATLLCPPVYGGGPCQVFPGLHVQAQLVRVSSRTSVGEVRGRGFPFIGHPFVMNKLLVWRLVWVPTVCTADGTGVSGSDTPVQPIFSTTASTPCRVAFDYLIDASTGDFVFID